jgi:hypothetical protein
MLISEFIAALQKFQVEHGDLEVETDTLHGWRGTHKGPVLAHRKVLQGRERNPGWAWCDAHRGDAVCRI